MASLDDIIKINDDEQPEMILDASSKGNGANDESTNGARDGSKSQRRALFTLDETKPHEGRVAYEGIYYLDRTNTYIPSKPLGKYILKNHQLTTLYYMLELEKMLFDVRSITTNPSSGQGAEPLEVISTHYTNVGVLSDKVGAGKSYCVMALLNEAKAFHGKQLPFRNATWGSSEIKTNKNLDTNILLVPHGLVGQWKKYLEGSGLKFYTIQKAKDIFGLADAECGFKGKNFAMIAKEDDVTVRPDTGDEPIYESLDVDDDPIDEPPATPPKKPSASAKGAKTKQFAAAAYAAPSNGACADEGPVVIKKKGAITKRSKAEIQATQAKKVEQELEEQEKQKANEEFKKKQADIRQLEKERKKLNAKLRTTKTDSFHKYEAIRKTKWGTPERAAAEQEHFKLEAECQHITEQIEAINKQIKDYDLEIGAIKITDIHHLHNAFENRLVDLLPEALQSFAKAFGHLDKHATEANDVILVSATYWNLFTLFLNRDKYTVNRVIIDECNAVKGNRMLEVRRGFTWLITSSIHSMMTDCGYIWKQVPGRYFSERERSINSSGFIMNVIKELYSNKIENNKIYLVNDPTYIEESMTLPELRAILVISKDNANIQVLQGVVSHDVLRMLNAGDIAGVITRLDVAVGDESNVIEMVTRKYQDDLKVKEYELRVAIENPKYNPKFESVSIINKREAIADLRRKIACIEERVKEVENCPICYDDFTNPALTPCCSNKFCLNCIAAALGSKAVCPMCKTELLMKNLILISDKSKAEIVGVPETTTKKKTKKDGAEAEATPYETSLETLITGAPEFNKYENMDKIFALNTANPVRKYLIFTEYENTLNSKITSILDKYGLTYARIRGTGVAIDNMVKTYHRADDKINVLLINSKYFGSGLNLENTSDIIILHKMQADIEMQVIGRAHRFGRKDGLRVWKLYYQNEVDA